MTTFVRVAIRPNHVFHRRTSFPAASFRFRWGFTIVSFSGRGFEFDILLIITREIDAVTAIDMVTDHGLTVDDLLVADQTPMILLFLISRGIDDVAQ